MMKITVKGIDKMVDRAKRVFDRQRLMNDLEKVCHQLGAEIVGTAQEKYMRGRPGLKNVSGRLISSIHYKVTKSPGGFFVTVGTPLVYSRIHEYGGIIRAKNAPYLKFRINNHWVQVKQVEIPKRPYLRPAIEDNRDRFKAKVKAMFKEMARVK